MICWKDTALVFSIIFSIWNLSPIFGLLYVSLFHPCSMFFVFISVGKPTGVGMYSRNRGATTDSSLYIFMLHVFWRCLNHGSSVSWYVASRQQGSLDSHQPDHDRKFSSSVVSCGPLIIKGYHAPKLICNVFKNTLVILKCIWSCKGALNHRCQCYTDRDLW